MHFASQEAQPRWQVSIQRQSPSGAEHKGSSSSPQISDTSEAAGASAPASTTSGGETSVGAALPALGGGLALRAALTLGALPAIALALDALDALAEVASGVGLVGGGEELPQAQASNESTTLEAASEARDVMT
ncbi:MAG: hypothetical protein R3B07_22635 [Polyangiaceae bacterium]